MRTPDREVDHEPEARVAVRFEAHVPIHPWPAVEVQLVRGLFEVVARVQDELEAAGGNRERLVDELVDDRLPLGQRQRLGGDGLDVEVAALGIEVAERGGTEQPHADETLAGVASQARDHVLQIAVHVAPCVMAGREVCNAHGAR